MLVESMVRPAPSSHWSAENVARFSAASLVVRYSKYSSAVISIENETEASDLGSVVSSFSSLVGFLAAALRASQLFAACGRTA